MGTNIHAFAHRLTALSMACLASAGIAFCALSGLGCSFIEIRALDGRSIGNAYGDVYESTETTNLGVKCLSESDSQFYNLDGSVDRVWSISRIFLYVGLGLGAATTLFAWMLGSCVRPTSIRWQILSILSALAAVCQIPIFLVTESDNCNFDITRQTCSFSTGAYLNVVSVSIWIVMTIWVQCLRAPRWDEELDAWRANGGNPAKGGRRDTDEAYGGINDTEETTEGASSPPRMVEYSIGASNTGDNNNNRDIEQELSQEDHRRYRADDRIESKQDPLSDGLYKESNDKSFFHFGQKWGRNRSKDKKSSPITDSMKRNLSQGPRSQENGYANEDGMNPQTALFSDASESPNKDSGPSFMKSMTNSIPRVQISKTSRPSPGDNESPHSLIFDSQSMHQEAHSDNIATVEKSIANDTGKHAVNTSQDTGRTAMSTPTAEPGFHISCVYSDGSKNEAHFPSMTNCCIGMGDPDDEEEETKFQRFPQASEDLRMVGCDDYDRKKKVKNSDSSDFLIRKLQKEEQAAAARRAKRNMAPVASFEFVTSNSLTHCNRGKNGKNSHGDAEMNDDISAMTRGSGWASGVSEILDDTDLRHQPTAILDGLAHRY